MFRKIANSIDMRDVFFLAGLGLLGYGLHIYKPWVSFTVVGALMMIVGYLMRGAADGHNGPHGSPERDGTR